MGSSESTPAKQETQPVSYQKEAQHILERLNHRRKPIHVLLVGGQHVGKSSVINTINSVLRQEQFHPMIAAAGKSASNCTKHYNKYELHNNLILFDTPGRCYQTDESITLFKDLLGGGKAGTDLNREVVTVDNDYRNKIDFVFLLTDFSFLYGKNKEPTLESIQDLQKLADLVRERVGQEPIVICTKADTDREVGGWRKVKALLSQSMAAYTHIHKVKSYLEPTETRNKDTELTVIQILSQLLGAPSK